MADYIKKSSTGFQYMMDAKKEEIMEVSGQLISLKVRPDFDHV